VLLFFDNNRYLFNAGEGIQRHFIEHKQRMKKVRQYPHCNINSRGGTPQCTALLWFFSVAAAAEPAVAPAV
jgi:hypothetical protein